MTNWTAESEAAFDAYVDALIGVIGHADRAEPLKDYCLGLLMPMERKSVEPLAAVTAPSRVAAKHQSLLHFVGQAPWSDAALLARVRDWVLPQIEQHGPIRAWIVDDTGFPKKGKHSVGVARQYCGQLGKQDNCQIAVSLSIANDAASLPIAYQLYLPHIWVENPEQRKKAKIPAEITFQTKPQIALEQIKTAKAEGVAPGVVLADAGYGADGGFRAGLSELDLTYVVGVQPTLSVWRPGESPLPPKPWSGRGRRPSRVGRTDDHKPISAKALAEAFDAEAWRTIAWREGTNTELNSRFAAVRLRPASRDYNRPEAHAEEWLLIEWPEGEVEPSKYWLSTLPRPTLRSPSWSTPPSCVGGSSETIRSSSKSWDWATTKAEVGGASTTTPVSVRRLWLPDLSEGDDSPLSSGLAPRAAKHLVFPTVIDRADPPIRPERHVPTSIPTLRRRLTVALANRLQRCPCCTRAMDSPRQANL